ncbi:precorrin-6A synthase (deacetylating) [Zavarzinia aquatilis]|uniref:Precorrin-6A synthase [deacetylating] n=1 Tax=Zavarzinia aquatilis TaxID=2211142 RepID=A0A317DTZ2_9PROT|nr:precorrin-6A synthase (deacetylating) [Zavarzinia aquatilis]PWR18157.1 precorrin-6A synthase (deacetylating) [Zavarzinia aquatilis]
MPEAGIHLSLIGIGSGNPDHVTLQAIKAINRADLVLIPRKGADKADLADLRRDILVNVLTNPATRIADFDLPVRDAGNPDYRAGVDDWHDAIAEVWSGTIAAHLPAGRGRVVLLIWGDPGLYDSSLRIAARLRPAPALEVIPGITAVQALTAAHRIPVNDIGAPFVVTTGRHLRDLGWPPGVDTVVVMLDGDCAFRHIAQEGIHIWWGAYVGMAAETILSGPLFTMAPAIAEARTAARRRHGWIMDIYILRRARA